MGRLVRAPFTLTLTPSFFHSVQPHEPPHSMLSIRLTRVGKRKRPLYRFIVTEKSRDPWGKALEALGTYDTVTNPATLNLKTERVTHWISKGAQCSESVWNLLIDQKIVSGEKRKKNSVSKRRKEKLAKKAQG